jgi:hypothetical protein
VGLCHRVELRCDFTLGATVNQLARQILELPNLDIGILQDYSTVKLHNRFTLYSNFLYMFY